MPPQGLGDWPVCLEGRWNALQSSEDIQSREDHVTAQYSTCPCLSNSLLQASSSCTMIFFFPKWRSAFSVSSGACIFKTPLSSTLNRFWHLNSGVHLTSNTLFCNFTWNLTTFWDKSKGHINHIIFLNSSCASGDQRKCLKYLQIYDKLQTYCLHFRNWCSPQFPICYSVH